MANEDLVLRVPHTLGATEAKTRIAGGVEAAKAQYGQYVRVSQLDWDANRLTFSLAALTQTIQGSVLVEDDYVELKAQLPWMIRMLAKKFVPVVQHTGQKLLK